ncbi:MAG: DNA-processing protein DprA [Steroidobacteraceae bacterium]
MILARAPASQRQTIEPLLAQLGSASAIANASAAALRVAGASNAFVDFISRSSHVAVTPDLRWLEHQDHHLIHWQDSRYPALLRELPDAPLTLYVHGDAGCLSRAQVAIVGSRNPTPSGRETAFELAQQMAQQGLIVTSGLAAGIDAAAHRGALSVQAQTIAVCGTGLDHVYPRSHRELAEQTAAHGALVSEFPLGMPAIKSNFPRRNRIISGLALGTIVVEAALRSGSLITARLAAEQGREVFAVPGSIRNPLAHGCHALIRQGAKLIEGAQDVLCELGPLAGTLTPQRETSAPQSRTIADPLLDKEYEILLDALGFEPANVDRLVARTGLNAGAVASMLLMLELDGRVESYAGGVFVRTRP